ncbi:endonuclease domain-containing protein [Amnibacterium endophyticum]|uniref:Endonuclease domain-containing protein n=1 Tax=Amnibacterium endophyticum TaxID=2109337 RepID=A0ABW4LF65_9MICO
MTPLQRHVEELGGLIKTAELHAYGLSRDGIAAAVAQQEIERRRQAWYSNPWLPLLQKKAARIGGQLTCSSAARALGLWEPRFATVHVAVAPDARALRSPDRYRDRLAEGQAVVHWTGIDPRGTRTLVSVATCVRQIARCESAVVALIVAESALQRGLISRADFAMLVGELPRHVRRILEQASDRSESASETVFAHRMAQAGVVVRQQVVIPGVGRVDALIGDRLVVELDSWAHHRNAAADRERDARLSALGYRVLRFMYSQVMEEWPLVQAAVLAALSRGDHLL